MIRFSRFTLDNGLRLLVHEDRSTPLVALNILYDVGSRDENPAMTGLAHLFEHLMFSGTPGIPEFDKHLQNAGGDNNAFTTPDITNYYMTLPAVNIETGLWLESDRMTGLNFTLKNLEVQKNVVTEEFNQRYLNQPYGDAMLILRPMAYKVHPYRWPTIGTDISHIRKADIEEIRKFFFSHYAPNNAILTLTGNITPNRAIKLVKKWFDGIENRKIAQRHLPSEPEQIKARKMTVEKDVPSSAIYKAWHTGPRTGNEFYTMDLITDLLAGGESGRLNEKLTRGKKLFSDINAYITADIDPGLILLQGKLMKGVDINRADEEIQMVISALTGRTVPGKEMEKVRNRYESANVYGNTDILNKAMNLSFFELLGDPDLINNEIVLYRGTEREVIPDTVSRVFAEKNCSTLYYKSVRDDR